MDTSVKLVKESPRKSASTISKLFFFWTINLFRKAAKDGLELMDMYKTLNYDQSNKLGDMLEKNWNKEVEQAKLKNAEPNLVRAISITFYKQYLVYGFLVLIQGAGLRTIQPIILKKLIGLYSVESRNDPHLLENMYIVSSILAISSLLAIFMTHHSVLGQAEIGMRLRIAVSTLIYRKLLKINKKSLGQTATGQIVNILSNDVTRYDFLSTALNYIWVTPFQIAIINYLLWDEIGISAFAGILAMVLGTLPVLGYLGKLTSKLREKTAAITDKRVRLMNEIISGIQVIKMYTWEKPFEVLVKMARIQEIVEITKSSYIKGVFISCSIFLHRMALYLTIICYTLLGNVITADKVFSLSEFLNILQLSITFFVPRAISMGAEALISTKRIKELLLLEEKQTPSIEYKSDMKITCKNIKATWNTKENMVLNDLSFEVPRGKLCAVVGPVASGKSSLLQLLLGELPSESGELTIGGKYSYSSQDPWLFNSSVRNNILFGQEFNKNLYNHVVKVCSLLRDFDQFPNRDKTLVGERGGSLSGGQKARINLARAIYREADIYLLDDPLSAVDTHVGKEIFEECILNFLNGKTRILVTHQLQYLKKADLIMVLNNGKIEAIGTFSELANSKLNFTKLLASADETDEKLDLDRRESVQSWKSEESLVEEPDCQMKAEGILLSDNSVLGQYFLATNSYCLLFLVSGVIILAQVAFSGVDYYVSYWTNLEETHLNAQISNESNTNYDLPTENGSEIYNSSYIRKVMRDNHSTETNNAMIIYTILIIAAIIFSLVRSFAFFKVCMISSKNLHSNMFHCLLKAPMKFFDCNPSGRILNRFSKDMGAVDDFLPRTVMETLQIMLVMISILALVAISNYYMIIAVVIFGTLFYILRNFYLKTSRIIMKIEGISKSPVFSHVNSSLNGITTIRACQCEALLTQQFDEHQDIHTSAFSLTISIASAFGLCLDFLSVLFTTIISFGFIVLNEYGEVSASSVGLALSQSLILTGKLQYGIRQSAEVINQLTSVERILEYTNLDKEGPFETLEHKKQPKTSPQSGNIKFKNMSLKYSISDPPVLKNLNFEVYARQKIGIVGRTGAGKSSLITALFHMAPLEGSIEIDGINTQSMGLTDLRNKISIIPQEPVLFSATLRYNLDPFKEYDDKFLWNALDQVELKTSIQTLDLEVEENGANFSVGQRQLLCLARAILRNKKILVLDEATANVDPKTDALIQTTIRKKFKDCTVLTIAHRLNTIMDSDKVLVLDHGSILEFDHPHILLQNEVGHFTRMVEQTGENLTKTSKQVAKETYENQAKNEEYIEETIQASQDGSYVNKAFEKD